MKKVLVFVILLLVIFTTSGCTSKSLDNEPSKEIEEKDELTLKVEETLKNMTLEEKIGQMLMVFYRSSTADDNLISTLQDVKPGGFILFSENFKSYTQAKKFVDDINSTSDIPMFISVDQEGGRVQRLKSLEDTEVTIIPSMQALGNTNDEKLSYEVGRVVGEELRVFGVNMDFAPSLDIYSNPQNTVIGNRAFGTTSEVVSKMGISFANGLKSTGVIPVYKHFPGHGDTKEDSHFTLPVINKTKEELMGMELLPFIDAIKNDAEVMMIGHLAVPTITGDNTPASLSHKLITELLKEELGYQGLVITDALNMKALTNDYSVKEIYVNAINAGVDILLMPSPSRDAIKLIKEAVVNKELTEEQINQSVEKILRLKYKEFQTENKYTKEYLGSEEHQEIISRIK